MAALTLTGISGNPLANVSLTGTLAGTSIGATLAGSQGFTVGVLTPTPPNNATVTIAAGNVLTGGGTFTTDQASNSTITINHEDVSSATSISGLTGAAVVSEVTVDTYGHVTGLADRNLTLANLGYTGATDADNYTSWSINADSAGADAVTSGETLNINTSSPLSSSYTAGTNTLTLSSTAITDVVDDLTPELGGDLTLGSNDIIGTGNINITGTITSTSDLTVSSGNVDVTGTITSTGDLTVSGGNVDITGTITSTGDIDSSGGSVIDSLNQSVRDIPQNATATGTYSLVASDAGKHVVVDNNVTIPVSPAVLTTGEVVTVFNNTNSNISIIHTGTTTYLAGTSGTQTSPRTLKARGIATILCVGTDTYVIGGAGVS